MPNLTPCVIVLALAGTAAAQTLDLKFAPTGALNRLGFFEAQTCDLSANRPNHITMLPKEANDAKDNLFGVIRLGPRENRTKFAVLLVDASTSDAKLYLDSNGDGDFTNDPSATWKQERYSGPGDPQTLNRQLGSAPVEITYDDTPRKGFLNLYRVDPKDPKRPNAKTQLFYYRDYGFEGTLSVGQYTYKAFLSDDKTTGDFRGNHPPNQTGVTLFIDVNGNNRLDRRSEAYDVRRSIEIGEQTFEVRNLTAGGDTISLAMVKNKVEVKAPSEEGKNTPPSTPPTEEPKPAPPKAAPPPDKQPAKTPPKPGTKPNLAVGAIAPSFTGSDLDSKTINFPDDYKGKIVLVDFWATWCKPCRDELPNVVAAYNQFHEKGFDVLGVSLDRESMQERIKTFSQNNNMPWKHVYDGKYWTAAVAQQYDIHSIPAAFLIDADTGKILASGSSARGGRLIPSVEKALREKSPK